MVKRNAIATKLTKRCTQTQKRAFDVAVHQPHSQSMKVIGKDDDGLRREYFCGWEWCAATCAAVLVVTRGELSCPEEKVHS